MWEQICVSGDKHVYVPQNVVRGWWWWGGEGPRGFTDAPSPPSSRDRDGQTDTEGSRPEDTVEETPAVKHHGDESDNVFCLAPVHNF